MVLLSEAPDVCTNQRARFEIPRPAELLGEPPLTFGFSIAFGKMPAVGHDHRNMQGAGDPLDSQGAGDQGLMFGYASNETPELMPAPIMFAHRLGRTLTKIRKQGGAPWLRPDAKSQVSVI